MDEFFIPADFDFGQQFDRVTLTRAMALEPERALLSMQIDGPALLTRLRGSGSHVYEQRIELPVDRRLGLQVRGRCSCPVGQNCKHVAAALMAFEAFEIRRRKNPAAAVDARFDRAPAGVPGTAASLGAASTSRPVALANPTALPHSLQLWLDELGEVAPPTPAASAATSSQLLMYMLAAQGTQLQLRLHLGNLRKNGEIGSQRQHAIAPFEMLRQRPSYVADVDLALLAALMSLPTLTAPTHLLLRGRSAMPTLRALLATGRAWVQPGTPSPLPAGPGSPAVWLDDVLPVRLHWHADAAGQWRTEWRHEGHAVQMLLLPEPCVLDPVAGSLQPARPEGVPLGVELADWLARMPAVPAELLPAFVDRLQTATTSRHLAVPLPPGHARAVRDLGALPLRPVLRLATCPDAASEAVLHDRLGAGAARQTRLRQASAELRLRYQPPEGPPVEFFFPAGAADTAFVQLPDGHDLLRFVRDARAEADALQRLFGELEFRPWSATASLALDRLARLGTVRLQSAAVPSALEGKPLLLVLRRREQWPVLLAQQIPALERDGWIIEIEPDFPFDTFAAETWEVQVEHPAGSDWFDIGVQIKVEGQPVNLVPLLIGLVQSGALSTPISGPISRDPAETADAGDVLVPWPGGDTPVPGQAPRQRLLRLPLQRVTPLLDWLRAMYRVDDKRTSLRVSRFDVGTLEALASGARLTAPPDFRELIDQLQRLHDGRGLPAVAVSGGVEATLRHYQLDGLAWMDFLRRARLGGVLADDMGLGKTLQALALLQGECDAGRLDRPSLVIVPTSLIGNWQAEAARFTPGLRLLVLHGPQRMQHVERIARAHVVVTSYPLAVRDFGMLAAHEWHYLVLDEAQRIKNSRSQAALTLKDLRARHRLCLSGTPLENHLGELWSLMDFVCPGLLGNEAQFREHYRNRIEKRHDTAQAEMLARRVRPFILRRTKQQVARELPEKTETLLRVELGGAQADLYETVRATMDKKLREAIARQGLARSQIMVLEALLKLRQVCCDPRLLKGGAAGSAKSVVSAKMELLLDLLPTLVDDGRRVLLFSQFTEMLELIEVELARLKLPYLKLTGETRDRAEVVAEFQRGDTPLLLVSLRAGGVGLNLTAADTVILYDPWWNPAVEQQAIDRAYRIGQDKPVFVYKLVASGTVEDKMLELQARKADLADLLLSGVASDAALNPQDFDELFRPLGPAP